MLAGDIFLSVQCPLLNCGVWCMERGGARRMCTVCPQKARRSDISKAYKIDGFLVSQQTNS